MHAEMHPILANLADERFWYLIVTAVCAFVGAALSTFFALFRVPRGQRRVFLPRVQTKVAVALFASLWSSLLLAGCVFMLFARRSASISVASASCHILAVSADLGGVLHSDCIHLDSSCFSRCTRITGRSRLASD